MLDVPVDPDDPTGRLAAYMARTQTPLDALGAADPVDRHHPAGRLWRSLGGRPQ